MTFRGSFPLFLGIICLLGTSNAVEVDLTVEVEAGRRECFHQFIGPGAGFEFEYQVIEGGELDVNFVISSPSGQVLLTELRKADGVHKMQSHEGGDYSFCLDNTFSRFSKKLVFFELITDEEDPNWATVDDLLYDDDIEAVYEMKLEDCKAALDRVKDRLDRSQQTQNVLRVYEARDRAIQESNFDRVNLFSGINLFVLISVGLIQVYMIRSLFEDRSKVGKILKSRT